MTDSWSAQALISSGRHPHPGPGPPLPLPACNWNRHTCSCTWRPLPTVDWSRRGAKRFRPLTPNYPLPLSCLFGSRAGYVTQAAPIKNLSSNFAFILRSHSFGVMVFFYGQSQSRDSYLKDDGLDIRSTDTEVVFE